MEKTISEITSLFEEAKDSIEFEFVQTLINYTGMGTKTNKNPKLPDR